MTDRAQEAARAMRETAARACQEVDDAERSATIGRPTSGEYGIAARHCAAAIRALPLPAPEVIQATAGGEAPQVEGLWPANDLRRAFVMGAKWWEFNKSSGFTMWPSDRDLAEAEAERRYPGGAALSAPAEAERAVVEAECPTLLSEVSSVLNRHSQENGSDTPDFILARYLLDCLAAWNFAIQQRERWYGRAAHAQPGAGA